MNDQQARQLCEVLEVNPDAPIEKKTRAEVLAEFFTALTAQKTAQPEGAKAP